SSGVQPISDTLAQSVARNHQPAPPTHTPPSHSPPTHTPAPETPAIPSSTGAPQIIRSDLDFVLAQILQAESGASPGDPTAPTGLRTVAGVDNNLLPGGGDKGAADQIFPRMTNPVFSAADQGTSYQQTSGTVFDAQPRVISNLIVDQNGATNPAAAALAS